MSGLLLMPAGWLSSITSRPVLEDLQDILDAPQPHLDDLRSPLLCGSDAEQPDEEDDGRNNAAAAADLVVGSHATAGLRPPARPSSCSGSRQHAAAADDISDSAVPQDSWIPAWVHQAGSLLSGWQLPFQAGSCPPASPHSVPSSPRAGPRAAPAADEAFATPGGAPAPEHVTAATVDDWQRRVALWTVLAASAVGGTAGGVVAGPGGLYLGE